MDAACEGSKGSEEHFIGNWRKGNPCCVLAKILATLSSAIIWKAEKVPEEFGNLAKEISKKC